MVKKGSFSKWISIAILSVFLLNMTAFAQSSSVFSSEYISYTNADITAEKNGRLNIFFFVRGTGIMTQLGATSIVVYEDDGSGFSPIKTFRYTDDGYSGMMGGNSVSHGAELYFTGTVGYKYYAEVNLKAGNQYGSDTFTETTPVVTAKKN